MVDKIRPLKIERPSAGGTQDDPFPTEANPLEDYAAIKGIAFEGSDSFLFDKIGRAVFSKFPNTWQKATYLSNGQLSNLEFFNSSSFIVANRIARIEMSYDSNLNPTSEVVKIYGTDGTSVLRTKTSTFVYSSNIFQSMDVSFT